MLPRHVSSGCTLWWSRSRAGGSLWCLPKWTRCPTSAVDRTCGTCWSEQWIPASGGRTRWGCLLFQSYYRGITKQLPLHSTSQTTTSSIENGGFYWYFSIDLYNFCKNLKKRIIFFICINLLWNIISCFRTYSSIL